MSDKKFIDSETPEEIEYYKNFQIDLVRDFVYEKKKYSEIYCFFTDITLYEEDYNKLFNEVEEIEKNSELSQKAKEELKNNSFSAFNALMGYTR